MHTPWLGTRKLAVIPAIVDGPGFDPPPVNWADRVRERLFYDPDPATGVDRSLRTYIHAVSDGRATLAADVFNPVVVQHSHCGAMQDAAIQATPAAHAYTYACVVFNSGTHSCKGWAFYDGPAFPFVPPPGGTNNLRNWCYVSMDSSLGVWAMETMHAMTGFGDLYKTSPHPGRFDNMACSCGTHPSTYTKLKLGWLDPASVRTVNQVNWTQIGHANDVRAMTAINDKLFAATGDNKLWWRDPVGQNVDWTQIGHANDVRAMAAINDKLFAATGDNKLWRRDPVGQNVDWTQIGHANDVRAMTALNGMLFAATGDNKLWWRGQVGQNVNWTQIGHANDVRAMAATDNKLFAATGDNKLWWRDPVRFDKSYTLHALSLLQPAPPGRVTAVKITRPNSPQYFLVEARLRTDQYERFTATVSAGIPSEGVVVYEVDEPRWPLQLRTPTALGAGEKYSSPGAGFEVVVTAAISGGFSIALSTL